MAFPVRIFPLKTIWILRPLGLLESKHGIMQHAWLVRESSCGFWPSSPCMHRVWIGVDLAFPSESKHGIMRHVQLTRNSLVHTDKSSPCMHSVWLGVDSGVPVRKQTRHHVPICTSSLLAFSCLKFSSRVNLDLQASRIFRPTPHTKIWSNFVRAPRWWCARRWLTVDTEDYTSARLARGGGAPGGG